VGQSYSDGDAGIYVASILKGYDTMCGMQSARYGVWDTGCEIRGPGYGVQDTECGIRGAGYGVRGTGYRV